MGTLLSRTSRTPAKRTSTRYCRPIEWALESISLYFAFYLSARRWLSRRRRSFSEPPIFEQTAEKIPRGVEERVPDRRIRSFVGETAGAVNEPGVESVLKK